MAKRFAAPQMIRLFAWMAAGAFLLAVNYCVCEAFTNHTHADASHQHTADGHHEEESPASDEQYDPCCATLQAIVTPAASILLAGTSQPFFQHAALPVVNEVRFADLPLAPSGLSPPARAPTPARPFYRTTYANHAPPPRLA